MKTQSLLAAAALALAVPATAASTAQAAEPSYQCTGIGLEARAAAEAIPQTLRLEFAQKGGQYLGNVAITITRGADQVISVTCPGPWLIADLPDGTYKVSATLEGKTVNRTVSIRNGKRTRAVIVF